MRTVAEGHDRPSGLLWLTGVPGAGKTTVGDATHDLMIESGLTNVVRIDGDALRQFLHLTTIETDEDRVTLGLSYLAFAEHLARQGQVVILSAVAMYDEVFAAFRQIEDLPVLVIRLLRDEQAGEPIDGVLDLGNPRDARPHAVAAQVLAACGERGLLAAAPQASVRTQSDIVRYARGSSTRRRHWDTYYRHRLAPDDPSSFARSVVAHHEVAPLAMDRSARLVDFGCGNGRDSRFLSAHFRVRGLDGSASAVDAARAASTGHHEARLTFDTIALDDLKAHLADVDPHVVYCRFVLHALSPEEETQFLDAVAHGCRPGTILAVETRTDADPMARRGSKISSRERVFGHYRRFIDASELHGSLIERGFRILESSQDQGVSALGGDDPVVLRVLARL